MSFFGKLRSSSIPASPTVASPQVKRDPNAPQPTPLEKLLLDAGPVRSDGSDKFFGMENFGNTCYCNSILQCLFFSVPFREHVINFPTRSPIESLKRAPNGLPRLNTDASITANGNGSPASPIKGKPGAVNASPAAVRRPGQAPAPPGQPGNRPEDNKDSPEYKKKQAMLNGPILNMDYENAPSYGMSESLFTSLKDIFEAIIAHQSRIGVVSPQKFLEVLKRDNEMFRTSMHQDAHEFLNLLLNEVVESVEANSKLLTLNREMNGHAESNRADGIAPNEMGLLKQALQPGNSTRWVHELFEGTLTSETKCLTCENISQRDESFLDLSVDLEQNSSVTACLRKFSEEEMLCERNKFHCDNCGGLQEAEKRMKIKRLPRVLALHLKRFKYTEDLQRLQKLFHRVVYPYHLRLFNTTDDAEDPDRLYELYAVVVHIGGGPYHGHYVSIIKTQDRGWLLFDDEMVEPVDKDYVRNFFGDKPGLACAYVLFYQETTLEAVQREQELEGLAASQATNNIDDTSAKLATTPMDGLYPVMTSPIPEDVEKLAHLDHASTAPALSPPIPIAESVITNGVALSPPGEPSLVHVKSKKERQREEKEQKAAEKAAEKEREKENKASAKEQEKARRQRLKDMEKKRLDYEKQQRDEIKAAIAASKVSQAEEEQKRAQENAEKEKQGSGGVMGTGLNRFKQSSKSLSRKPKLWGSREKDLSRESEELKESPEEAMSNDDTDKPAPLQPPKHERSKSNLFSLRKKSSNVH